MRGTNISFISKADLQELSVPVPPLLVQAQIADLNRLCTRERELLNELSNRKQALIDAVCTKLAASGN
jgi:restriction endonuclease S subunit